MSIAEVLMQYLEVIRNTDTFDLQRREIIEDAIRLAVMLYRSNNLPKWFKAAQERD